MEYKKNIEGKRSKREMARIKSWLGTREERQTPPGAGLKAVITLPFAAALRVEQEECQNQNR